MKKCVIPKLKAVSFMYTIGSKIKSVMVVSLCNITVLLKAVLIIMLYNMDFPPVTEKY